MNPFTAFNFRILVTLDGAGEPLCEGAFSQCDGLEVSMAPKTIRAGGDNGRQIHLGGPMGFGTAVLKRGMTDSFDLWKWFERVNVDHERHLRATCQVLVLAADGRRVQAAFVLDRCLPTKLRVPGLDALTGQVAVEELQVAYERIRLGPVEGSDRA